MAREQLSLAQARRIALAAQGFGDRRFADRDRTPDLRTLKRVVAPHRTAADRLGQRAGPRPLPPGVQPGRPVPARARRASGLSPAARAVRVLGPRGEPAPGGGPAVVPVADGRGQGPCLGWHAAGGPGATRPPRRPGRRHRRPLTASELAARHDKDRPKRSGPWWDWSDVKRALEFLFWSGQVTTATRRGFERAYDLPERVLPRAVLDSPTPSREDAQRELVRRSIRSLGVAAARDLRDYYRLPAADAKARIAELVETGELQPVAVEGWRQPAYLDPSARLPRRVSACALLVPFDPLVWERDRTERMFGFRYRIEIYVPAPARVHGYYVLPFLLDEALVARVDLKADRAAGVLRVQGAFGEPDAPPETAERLRAELESMAQWLDLSGIEIVPNGDLAHHL